MTVVFMISIAGAYRVLPQARIVSALPPTGWECDSWLRWTLPPLDQRIV